MATTKSKPASKRPSASKGTTTEVKTNASKTATAAKKTVQSAAKKATKKTAPKKATPHTSAPKDSGLSAKKLAEQALRLMEDAHKAVKSGVTHGAENADTTKAKAKKQAAVILDKSGATLTKAIGDVTSGLKDLISKF